MCSQGFLTAAQGVVVKTGDDTVMGCIAGLVATLDSGKSPINKEISKFVNLVSPLVIILVIVRVCPQITIIALSIGLVFFIIAMVMEYQ